jgi:hypothetical protein
VQLAEIILRVPDEETAAFSNIILQYFLPNKIFRKIIVAFVTNIDCQQFFEFLEQRRLLSGNKNLQNLEGLLGSL